jgi:hypothetical protein
VVSLFLSTEYIGLQYDGLFGIGQYFDFKGVRLPFSNNRSELKFVLFVPGATNAGVYAGGDSYKRKVLM